MPSLLVGAADGLHRFDEGAGRREAVLAGHKVTAVAPAGWKRLWAVVDDREVWRSEALDGEWKRIASLDGRRGECLADTRANDENGMLVGTDGRT